MDANPRHSEMQDRIQDLMKTVRMLKQSHSERAAGVPTGLITTLKLISKISDDPSGCHAKQLAHQAALDPSTVSRAVAALVGQGLVERQADPVDGRASILVVTPAGQEALDRARRWYEDLMDRALAGWTPEELDAFNDALGRLNADVAGAIGSPSTALEDAR
ncbi:winged helix-turn-helix transcriptional regulator [Actinosynnema pretiosum subsp. pretiosum]|uniref:Transcriptional regulator, MarR family n=3 Tax=Actinosynnema TaxID=40566 RepID=C6WLA9_ACTMD|nr:MULTISPECIES: MarR family winged helix-turn-helix transcriptional regulator [Actinosynnema]ACU36462.1 transcriptional regulator, MarR family [Actinosynnema mirum DSM 43827]ATE54061.1 MarR family transcriptional regulator [Actinosynnema pretiosum]AXX29912.1 Transcriptional regulator, MarR family [Actinosynnema pretiosum subsp. pretiosum]QUF05890.1 winged helix-turn-helix transcriptional regulator [Actinosynnema pretiosum subsp. pretiosum]